MLSAGARELAYYLEALGPSEICRLCGVHRTTLKRWLDGTTHVPRSVLVLLKIITSNRLPSMGKEWAGWCFQGSNLYTPSNEAVSPGEILAMPYRRALIREQQKQIAHLRGLVERLTREIAQLGPAANDGQQWPFEPRPVVSVDVEAHQFAGGHPGHFARRGRP